MTASLCWPGTNYDSKITVYRGDCNAVMDCVNANDDVVVFLYVHFVLVKILMEGYSWCDGMKILPCLSPAVKSSLIMHCRRWLALPCVDPRLGNRETVAPAISQNAELVALLRDQAAGGVHFPGLRV